MKSFTDKYEYQKVFANSTSAVLQFVVYTVHSLLSQEIPLPSCVKMMNFDGICTIGAKKR